MARDEERLWDDCADEAIRYIEDKADSREIRDNFMLDLRRNYADQLGKDRWRSRPFGDVVDGIVASLKRVERELCHEDDREKDIIAKAVEVVVDGHFAELVLSNRDISNELDNRVYNEMKEARRTAQEMVEGSRRSRGSRDDRDDDDRGSRRRGSRDRDDRDRGSRDRDDRYSRSTSRRDDRRDGRSSSTDDHWASGALEDDRDDDRDRDNDRDRDYDRKREPVAVHPEYDHIVEAPRRVEETPPAIVQGPDFTKAHPYDDYWIGEDHFQAAHLSRWKLTGDGIDLLSTIPSVYDVNTHIKYYVMDESGKIREELVEVTEDNRHLAHQLREEAPEAKVIPRHLGAGISLAKREDGIVQGRIEEDSPDVSLAQLLKEIPEDQLALSKADTIDSIQGAVFESQVKMFATEGAPRIDLHILRTPVLVRSEEQLKLIDKVHAAATLTEACDLLNELRPQFEKPLWETLNRRFSDNIKRVSTFQFQFELKKMNFATSYGKLLNAFRQVRGDEEVAQFAKRITFVNDLACCHILKEEIPALAGDLIGDATGVTAAIFIDFCAIVSVDHTLDEIGIGLQLLESAEGMAIENTRNRDLFTQIRNLYSRLDEVLPPPQKGRLLLSTSDNRLVEVLPFAARKEAFILTPAAV